MQLLKTAEAAETVSKLAGKFISPRRLRAIAKNRAQRRREARANRLASRAEAKSEAANA